MSRAVPIACLQTRPMPDMEGAVAEARAQVEAAATGGARLLFLPEYCGGLRSEGPRFRPPAAPEASHPVLAALRELAARHGVWINVGSIAVEGPDGRILNRGFMIDGAGAVTGRYTKIHLFDVDLGGGASHRESATVAPGAEAVVHDTPFGRIGHAICYDLRFPQLFRDLARAGAEILCCPSAFTRTTGEAHWHVLNRARAIETTRFVVSACAVGPVPGGGESYGHSLIVDPWGVVLADGGREPGVVRAEIDLAAVAEAAARVPSLAGGRDYAQPAPAPSPAAREPA